MKDESIAVKRYNSLGTHFHSYLSSNEECNQNLVFCLLFLEKEIDLKDLQRLIYEKVISKYERITSVNICYCKPTKAHGFEHSFFRKLRESEVDLDWHVQTITEHISSIKDVVKWLEKKIQEKMDRSKPLWRLYKIPPLKDCGRCLIVAQFCHSLGNHIYNKESFLLKYLIGKYFLVIKVI
jgi:hypothetical protein